MKKIVCIGSGGHFRPVLDAATLSGYNVIGVVDLNFLNEENIFGVKVFDKIESIKKFDKKNTSVFIAIGDNKIRSKQYNLYKKNIYNFINIIHPSTIISNNVKLGNNVFINAGSIINSDVKIGDNSIVNTGCIIDHETVIGKNTHIAPGSVIAGRCEIGDSVLIGIGAKIIQKIKIGNNSTIGAGSVLINNAIMNKTYVGIPAKIKK